MIVDTSPGLARLSFDVLKAGLGVNGSRVFVLRPRPVDVCQLCLEEDWIVMKPDLPGACAAVVNFVPTEAPTAGPTDYSDEAAVAGELRGWPQLQAYATRYLGPDASAGALAKHIASRLKEFGPVTADDAAALRRSGTLFEPDRSVAKAVQEDSSIMTSARSVVDRLTAQWNVRG